MRGKRRARTDGGICSTCGKPLPHTVALVKSRSTEEQAEAVERTELAFGPPSPRPAPKRLRPAMVLMLRAVGCKVTGYPQEGTEAWVQFEADYRSALSARLSAIPKRVLPRYAPDSPERVVATETPL